MCHLLRRKKVLHENPFQDITLKQQEGKRQYLTETELGQLRQLHYKKESRERLTLDVYLFSVYTGVRFGDLATLRKSDIQLAGTYPNLSIRMQKTKKQIQLGLNQQALSVISKYVKTSKNGDYVFPMLKGLTSFDPDRIKTKIGSVNAWMNILIKTIVKDAGINKHISMHTARHSHAVLSLDKGANIYTLSQMLGHSSVKTTELYLKLTQKKRTEFVDLWNN